VNQVLAVLPFERELYEGAGVPVAFVGHPLLDVLPLDLGRDEARRRLGLDPSDVVVGILPGSRRDEVRRLLPAMLDAGRRLASAGGARRFVLGLAPTVDRTLVAALLADSGDGGGTLRVDVLEHRTYEVMAAADVILVASGTATLEAALLGVPMVVCYRVSRITEGMVRLLVRVPWASLPNIVSGRAVVPEVLQDEVTGERLAVEVQQLLEEPLAATAQRAAFKDLRARLGEPGVARRAAAAVLSAAARTGGSRDGR
jgi:lipid-A-disaccharide synthase